MDLSPHWKINISSAAQEIKSVLRNEDVHYSLHNSPLIVLVLSQINPVQELTFYFRKVVLNIILPYKPSSSNLSTKFMLSILSPIRAKCHCPFDVCGSVYHSKIHTEISNKMQECVKIYYSIFTWSSTCFGRHTAHHQEPKIALAASGFCIRRRLSDVWLQDAVSVLQPHVQQPSTYTKSRGC
jgi:hypothetical protein